MLDVGKETDTDEDIEAKKKDTEVGGKDPQDVDDFLGQRLFNPILYTRGVDSDSFHLILNGKVQICSGNEGFMIT